MRRVLMISAHFPPDSTAGTHRVRLLAPHLRKYGWEPTVLTLDLSAYEGATDPALLNLVDPSLRVVRCAALPVRFTRLLGVGDLGLRGFVGLYRTAARLLKSETYQALFITIFPAYTALLGPRLARRFKIPFVLDYQDPWVGAWGDTVGGGQASAIDFKSRASRTLALWLEPKAVRHAQAITAVSPGTYEPILERYPDIKPIVEAIPIGAEPNDFAGAAAARNPYFDPSDGLTHICYTGTILPLGFETLEAVLRAVRLMRDRRPELYGRLHLHFFGTTNQSVQTDEERVLPLARRPDIDVAGVVQEIPTRIPYTSAIAVMRQATALLAIGSSERHYTASKIFPMLLARRPMLAIFHESSTVTDIVRRIAREPSVSLVTYSDDARAASKRDAIYEHLVRICERARWSQTDVDTTSLSRYFAESLAGKLAGVFDRVAGVRPA